MTNHGKWSLPDIPHRGWECIDVVDLGYDYTTCEMCEHQSIRYVHYMRHEDYADQLGVGCVCAENMLQDYVGPRRREANLKNAARRRAAAAKKAAREREEAAREAERRRAAEAARTAQRRADWLAREWQISRNGNRYTNVDGFNIVIFPYGSDLMVRVKLEDGTSRIVRGQYKTEDAAKLAALNAISALEASMK